jgi:glycosyltransferase involved in cell wall biosynthesis
MGFETSLIAWNRKPQFGSQYDLADTDVRMLVRETPYGKWSAAGQLAFLRHIVQNLRTIRPDVVCAVNEELALLLLPFKGVLFERLICEMYDSLDARLSGAAPLLRGVATAFGSLARRYADRLIVTDENRLRMIGRHGGKTIVIENVPEDPGCGLARQYPVGPIKIWAAGTLDELHGLRQLLEAVRPLEGVVVVSAGWPYDEFAANEFVRSPRVEYQGVVSSRRALELAASCDAVFCYYAPVSANMINASPNKIYDAMAIGRPILVNREVKVAAQVLDDSLGFTSAYDDVESLRAAICRLREIRSDLPEFATRSRALFSQHQWGLQEPKLADLYRSVVA